MIYWVIFTLKNVSFTYKKLTQVFKKKAPYLPKFDP